MSEKVLGFKKKNASKENILASFPHLEKEYHYTVCEKDLVPVVSVEALKEWIEENKLSMVDRVLDVSKLEDLLAACSPDNNFKEVVSASDLLAWAEKEAGKV